MRDNSFWFSYVFAAALLVAGCGGGTSSGVATTGSSIKLGQASIGFVGRMSPEIATGVNSVTVTGMAGASVTEFEMRPYQTLENTSIAYSNGGATWLYTNGIDAPIEGVSGGYFYDSCWTNDGHIALTGFDAPTDSFQVFEANYDGSGLTKLTSSTHMRSYAMLSWAPNGSKMAYDAPGGIYTANTNGSDETLVVAKGSEPAISPNGAKLAYSAASGGKQQIFVVPIGGGTPTLISQSSVAKANNCYYPAWAPGGEWIAFNVDTGSDQYIEVQRSDGSIYYYDIPRAAPMIEFDNQPSYSPDGNYLAFMSSSTYQGPGSLTVAGAQGQSPITEADPNPLGLSYPAWSPFPGNQLFVGAGGTMFPSAAGFLWGQNGDVFASLVTFTATTPSTATVTPQGTSGNAALVYDLYASSITGLKYTNGYYAQTFTVIPGASAAVTDILVSFSAASGQVTTVAPFVATRTAGKPLSSVVGNQLVVSGEFLGVWNSQGRNIAPQGASQIVLDQKSGNLVRFH